MTTNRKKVLVLSPNISDACSFWRTLTPFKNMQDEFDFEFFHPVKDEGYSWSRFYTYDAIYMQRPYRPADLVVLETCEDAGIPLWVDYDDNLFELPFGNRATATYANQAVQKNLSILIEKATVVTTTTEALKRKLKEHRKGEVEVIPNAWDNVTWPKKQPVPQTFNKSILWRGGASHAADLDAFLPQMIQIADKYPDVRWLFWGHHDWKVEREFQNRNVKFIEANNPPGYIRNLNNAGKFGGFGVIPLVDCEFNRCKSNISWMEFTYANQIAIAPSFPEFMRPGAHNYSQEKTLLDCFEAGLEQGNVDIENSWEFISDSLFLTRWNEKRREILRNL